MAQRRLRNLLACVNVLLAQPEVFVHFREELVAADGTIGGEDTKKFLQGFVDNYVAWVKRFRS